MKILIIIFLISTIFLIADSTKVNADSLYRPNGNIYWDYQKWRSLTNYPDIDIIFQGYLDTTFILTNKKVK